MRTPPLRDLLDTSTNAATAAQRLVDAAAVIPAVDAALGDHEPQN